MELESLVQECINTMASMALYLSRKIVRHQHGELTVSQ